MEESKMVLRTEDLVKKYGKRTVVSHVSIDVKQGEIVGLLGPNGAGKTTSFYMTVGLITPNEGRIFLDDLDITKYPVYKRAQTGIGYLAQEASVFRQMSVEDNIASVLEMMKQRRVDAEQKYLFGDITVTAAEELFAEDGSTEPEAAGNAGSMRTGIAGGAGDAGNTGKGEE